MIILVFDADILFKSPMLRGPEWVSFEAHAREWDVRLVVPEVVLMETVNNIRNKWNAESATLKKLKLGEFGFDERIANMVAEIAGRCEAYEIDLRARFREVGIEVTPLPAVVDHMAIARRACERRAPYGGKDPDGYRDTLTWLTVVDLARSHPDAQVWMVSNNTTDFGPDPTNSNSFEGWKRDDCPIQLGPDLLDDLEAAGLTNRVHYVASAARVEQHIAAQFAPIEPDELRSLEARLDKQLLAAKFVAAIHGVELNPAAVAVPLDVATAAVAGVVAKPDGWRFSDAARRGHAGWTAQYVVEVELEISTVSRDIAFDEVTKTLRVHGVVTVAPSDDIQSVSVSAVEALDDDPRLTQWRGRAAIHAIVADLLSRDEAGSKENDAMQRVLVQVFAEVAEFSEAIRVNAELRSAAAETLMSSTGSPTSHAKSAQPEPHDRD